MERNWCIVEQDDCSDLADQRPVVGPFTEEEARARIARIAAKERKECMDHPDFGHTVDVDPYYVQVLDANEEIVNQWTAYQMWTPAADEHDYYGKED